MCLCVVRLPSSNISFLVFFLIIILLVVFCVLKEDFQLFKLWIQVALNSYLGYFMFNFCGIFIFCVESRFFRSLNIRALALVMPKIE